MTPRQAINNLKFLQKRGALDLPERDALNLRLAAAVKEGRVSDMKTRVALNMLPGADSALAESLLRIAQDRLRGRGRLTQPTALLIDKSGSMQACIEVGKILATMCSTVADSDLWVYAFDTNAFRIEAHDHSFAAWQHAFSRINADGGTTIGAGLLPLMKQRIQQIVVISDGEENGTPTFADVLLRYEAEHGPCQVTLVKVGNSGETTFEASMRKHGMQIIPFNGDYYSLPDIIPLLCSGGQYGLLQEVLALPLYTRPDLATLPPGFNPLTFEILEMDVLYRLQSAEDRFTTRHYLAPCDGRHVRLCDEAMIYSIRLQQRFHGWGVFNTRGLVREAEVWEREEACVLWPRRLSASIHGESAPGAPGAAASRLHRCGLGRHVLVVLAALRDATPARGGDHRRPPATGTRTQRRSASALGPGGETLRRAVGAPGPATSHASQRSGPQRGGECGQVPERAGPGLRPSIHAGVFRDMILCGIGTLGAHLAESLVRTGWDGLTVIDHDRVEARNLQNQPYGRADVGRPKTRALCEMLHRATGARVHGIEREIAPESASRLLSGADLVVDALDNHAARAIVQQVCHARAIPLLHLGLSRDGYGEVRWDAGYDVPPDHAGDPAASRSPVNLPCLWWWPPSRCCRAGSRGSRPTGGWSPSGISPSPGFNTSDI